MSGGLRAKPVRHEFATWHVADLWGVGHGYGGHEYVGCMVVFGLVISAVRVLGLPALVAPRVQGFCPLVWAVGFVVWISA